MAVAYKLNSALQRTEAVRQNIQNGISYLQVQDGALAVTGKILSRMAELRTMASDITKNSSDIENYSKEFVELQSQMHQIRQQKFNGLSLFAVSGMATADFSGNPPQININTDGGVYTSSNGTQTYDKYSRTLYTHESGLEQDGSISLNVVNLQFVLSLGASGDLGGFNNPGSSDTIALNGTQFLRDIEDFDISLFTSAIEKLSDMRAENGAEQNRLSMASDLLALNQTNLEAAHGRIMDADIALESTRMARQNVLVQASASMVAQANQLTSIALTVLG
jgi:flagellin